MRYLITLDIDAAAKDLSYLFSVISSAVRITKPDTFYEIIIIDNLVKAPNVRWLSKKGLELNPWMRYLMSWKKKAGKMACS